MCSPDYQISIHAPREGSDSSSVSRRPSGVTFLSTLPARGATIVQKRGPTLCAISIHAPREGSDSRWSRKKLKDAFISIHAPREGSDGPQGGLVADAVISIHAPREGSDEHRITQLEAKCKISIHAPREGSDWS